MYNPNSSQRKRIIAIGGTPCSGKSTVNEALAQQLGYQTHSVGSWVKKLALERGVIPEIFYEKNEIEIDGQKMPLDPYLDSWQQQLGEQQERFILDSRLGFYFVPQSFRVFLSCDAEAAAQRAHQSRKGNPNYATVEKALQTLKEREKVEKENYAGKYGVPDFHLPFHYDLPIDTTRKTPDDITKEIIAQYRRYEQMTANIELICKSWQMFVGNSFIYLSGPITGGKSVYDTMKKHNVKKVKDLPAEVYGGLIDRNLERSKRLKQELEKKGGTYILPGEFGSDKTGENWTQRDYVDLSKEGMRLKATEFVFEDGWEYSNGSVEEFLLALSLKRPMLDQRGGHLGKKEGVKLVTSSVEEIHSDSLECPKLDFLLEQLRRV